MKMPNFVKFPWPSLYLFNKVDQASSNFKAESTIVKELETYFS